MLEENEVKFLVEAIEKGTNNAASIARDSIHLF